MRAVKPWRVFLLVVLTVLLPLRSAAISLLARSSSLFRRVA